MRFTPGYGKRTFSEGDKQIALERQKDGAGVARCGCGYFARTGRGCGAVVTRETAEFDHVIAFWLSRHSGLSNCAALTVTCHKRKTRRDRKVIAKTKRLMKRRKARHPFPCGRESRWSKPVNGIPVPRTSLAQKHAATMRKRAIFTQQPEA